MDEGKKKKGVPRHQTLKIILGIASKQRDLVNLLRKMAHETKAEKKNWILSQATKIRAALVMALAHLSAK